MQTVQAVGPGLGVAPTCAALALSRATYYRSLSPRSEPKPRTIPRALTPGERRAVLEILHEPRLVDQAPAEVYATLLDEESYLCSERTMYRNPGRESRSAGTAGSAEAPVLRASRAPGHATAGDLELGHRAPRGALNRAVMKGHGHRPVAAGRLKLRAA